MSTTNALLAAAGGLAVSESVGATNVTSIGRDGSDDNDDRPGGGRGPIGPPTDVLEELARGVREARDRATEASDRAGQARDRAESARSTAELAAQLSQAGQDPTQVVEGVGGEEVARIVEAVKENTPGGGDRGDGDDQSSGDGGGHDATRDEPLITIGQEDDTPAVEFTDDPTGVWATWTNAREQLDNWGDEQTGEAEQFLTDVAGGEEDPLDAAAAAGDGPLGGLASSFKTTPIGQINDEIKRYTRGEAAKERWEQQQTDAAEPDAGTNQSSSEDETLSVIDTSDSAEPENGTNQSSSSSDSSIYKATDPAEEDPDAALNLDFSGDFGA